MHMNIMGFVETLDILWRGMLAIFIVTLVIMLGTMLLTRLTHGRKTPPEDGDTQA